MHGLPSSAPPPPLPSFTLLQSATCTELRLSSSCSTSRVVTEGVSLSLFLSLLLLCSFTKAELTSSSSSPHFDSFCCASCVEPTSPRLPSSSLWLGLGTLRGAPPPFHSAIQCAPPIHKCRPVHRRGCARKRQDSFKAKNRKTKTKNNSKDRREREQDGERDV